MYGEQGKLLFWSERDEEIVQKIKTALLKNAKPCAGPTTLIGQHWSLRQVIHKSWLDYDKKFVGGSVHQAGMLKLSFLPSWTILRSRFTLRNGLWAHLGAKDTAT